MTDMSPLTLDDEFAGLTRYLANHMRYKEVQVAQSIEDGEITTEEERDMFLICAEPLEDGFKDLPEVHQVIIDLPAKNETIEAYAARMAVLSEKASYLIKRSEDLSGDIDPKVVAFIQELADHESHKDKDQANADLDNEELGFDAFIEDMDAFDKFILKAREVMGDPEPIAVPGSPAPGR